MTAFSATHGDSLDSLTTGPAMKLDLLTGVAVLALLAACGVACAAGDAQAGKAKTAGCAGCHGVNGEGVGQFPPLAGWSETQIVDALQELKSGKLIDPVMNPMANMLSDQDMADIGAYYASLKK
jgi:cytochrome c553